MKRADLSPADRGKLDRGDIAAAAAARPAGSRRRTRPPGEPASTGRSGTSHRCEHCGATFAGYPKAERHVDEAHGAGRIAVLL